MAEDLVKGNLHSYPIDPINCEECGQRATRFFTEDFPDLGRTRFIGHYCDDHTPVVQPADPPST